MLDIGKLPLAAPGLVVGLAGAAIVLVLLRHAVRSRRLVGRAAAALCLALAGLTFAASVADAVNVHFGYLPTAGDAVGVIGGGGDWTRVSAAELAGTEPGPPDGGVASLRLPDRGSGFGASTALVYLPRQYFSDPTARFPVVYLLHGSPGVPADWLRGGRAAVAGAAEAAAGHPVIIAMPAMSHAWLDDTECVDGRVPAASHFLDDVVPGVDAALRTVPDRRHRVLAGMSAGGYCALNLGLRHRDLVATIVDMSGLDRPTHGGGVRQLYGPGRDALADAAADSPVDYIPALPVGPPTRVWLATGDRDHEAGPDVARVYTLLRARSGAGVSVQLHRYRGGHTFYVWRPALAQSLAWALSGVSRR